MMPKGIMSASTGALYQSLESAELSAEISAVHDESSTTDQGYSVQNVSLLPCA